MCDVAEEEWEEGDWMEEAEDQPMEEEGVIV